MKLKFFFVAFVFVVLVHIPQMFSVNPDTGIAETSTPIDQNKFENLLPSSGQGVLVDRQQLLQLFDRLQPPPEPEQEIGVQAQDAASAAEPAVDKTLRPNFQTFDDDHQIGLVAVVLATERFAVVELQNFESKQSEFKKIQENAALFDFQLKKLTKTTALFAKGNREIKLVLFNKRGSE